MGVAGAALLLTSCQQELTPPANHTPVRPLTTQEARTVGSANDFAFRAFAALRQDEASNNLFISPFSISAALSMAYNGADGTTKTAISQTLGFTPQTDEEINQSYKSLAELLVNIDPKVTFTLANSIWYARQFQLQAPFVQNNQTYFNATVEPLNFDSPEAKTKMNDWVKAQTKGKITDIVQEVRPDHVMFLINAIYFKGTWTYPFDKKLTKQEPFYKADGTSTPVDFMTLNKGKYLYYQDADQQVIDLPYSNRQYSMTILVPKENRTIHDITNNLTNTQLNAWLANADSTGLELHLPKFKLEYKKELRETLTQLGMGEAFSNQANFNRMLADNGQLAISEVMHKTFLEVNEEGTEAAAATSVGIVVTSLPPSIRVDRPFVFLIREKSSNAILFIGQLMNP
jgi:serpin B